MEPDHNTKKYSRKLLWVLLILATTNMLFSQVPREESKNLEFALKKEFKDLEAYLEDKDHFWDTPLYGPMFFVDPNLLIMYANSPDSSGILKQDNGIYKGVLPDRLGFANTALDWEGLRWTMLMLPLPNDELDKRRLLIHELFHRIQPALNLNIDAQNPLDHLDKKDGRIFFKMEINALRSAVTDTARTEYHIQNALSFRSYRHQLYESAGRSENQLELNEGLAEYTGIILTYQNSALIKSQLQDKIERFLLKDSFSRTFAYITLPIYGYFMYSSDHDWHKNVRANTDLTSLLKEHFDYEDKSSLASYIPKIMSAYNGDNIVQEEMLREERIEEFTKKLKRQFISSPTVKIKFHQAQYSFNPNTVKEVEGLGTYFKGISIDDIWGKLIVEGEALVNPEKNLIKVTPPDSISSKHITGTYWTLELNEGWKFMKIGEDYTIEQFAEDRVK